MIKIGVDGELIIPFLQEAAKNEESGWAKTAFECLSKINLKWVGVNILLAFPSSPAYLVKKALQNVEGLSKTIEMLCRRKEIPEKTLLLLLCHSDPLISGNAAIGEWAGEPKGNVRESLKQEWEKAILRIDYNDYWLGEILKGDPTLSFKWLKAYITKKYIPYEMLRIYRSAIAPLSNTNRKELLKIVPNDTWQGEIVNYLIGDSLELYQVLLKDKSKKKLHLLLLHGFKRDTIGEEIWEEKSWTAKAKMALDVGYTPEEIESAILSSWSFSGNESDMWKRWITHYDRLSSNSDPRIQKVGEIGKAKALKNLERTLKEERKEAIYGYD